MQYASLIPTDGLIVELGAEFGRSAGALWSASRKNVSGVGPVIVSVDLFPDNMWNIYRFNLHKIGIHNIITIRDNSQTLNTFLDPRTGAVDGQIDLLFIDADHHYEGILQDLRLWSPRVAMQGYMILHDVAQVTNLHPHAQHEEVASAIRDWRGDSIIAEQFEWVDSVWSLAVFQRVGVK